MRAGIAPWRQRPSLLHRERRLERARHVLVRQEAKQLKDDVEHLDDAASLRVVGQPDNDRRQGHQQARQDDVTPDVPESDHVYLLPPGGLAQLSTTSRTRLMSSCRCATSPRSDCSSEASASCANSFESICLWTSTSAASTAAFLATEPHA